MASDAAAAAAAEDQDDAAAAADELAAAAKAGPEGCEYITRNRADGTSEQFAIFTPERFYKDVFCVAFDMPGQIMPPFRHIAINNGDPLRPEAARVTSDRIHRACKNSGNAWLQGILSFDGSGLKTFKEIALVGWFAWGTLGGVGRAVAEIRAPAEDPNVADPARSGPLRPTVMTHEIHGGAAA